VYKKGGGVMAEKSTKKKAKSTKKMDKGDIYD
jgi:hypothetical protein